MGNEASELRGIEVEEEAVEVTDSWSLHFASVSNGNVSRLSVFVSQNVDDSLSRNKNSRLQSFARNLMLHRHPCILKYYSLWNKNSRLYLATEEVKPLSQVITNQTSLQICIGLFNIVKALVFLHENAQSSHNNVCCSSVYVTSDGVWKLGGLEFLQKFPSVNIEFLQETRGRRFEKAVPPEEDSLDKNKAINAAAIDQFGFGVFAEELLKKKTDEIPCLLEFRDLCKKQLQASDPSSRMKFTQILQHPFFTHEFIKIHSFLVELALRNSEEKQTFFRELSEQLKAFPENIVGSQLASLLLSRIVMLDQTAQQHLLPNLLLPKIGDNYHGSGIFSQEAYREYVVPKLLQMFCVRDAQIRLLLLSHFPKFCSMFTKEQLQTHILPELLVGIKDTNDHLVSITLRSLAELIPILGATTVIGGTRSKLFTDGRPSEYELRNKVKERVTTRNYVVNDELPERPSPDGGEDNSSSTTVEEIEGESEAWSDWDVSVNPQEEEQIVEEGTEGTTTVIINKLAVKQDLPDITSLDIKNSSTSSRRQSKSTEVDYFQDMEPVISKTNVVHVNNQVKVDKFQVDDEVAKDEEGWEYEDWGDT